MAKLPTRRIVWLVLAALGFVACLGGGPGRELDPRIECSRGACSCKTGFDDCDDDARNGCESDLSTDYANCSVCGHGCLGGACVAGLCQSVPVMNARILGLGLTRGSAYFAACSEVFRVDEAGSRSPVATAETDECLRGFGVGDDALFTATKSALVRFPLDELSSPSEIAPLSLPDDIELRALRGASGWVYWTVQEQDGVFRVPDDGASAPEFIDVGDFRITDIDGEALYGVAYGYPILITHEGGFPEELAELPDTLSVVAGEEAFWIWSLDGIFRLPRGVTLEAPVRIADPPRNDACPLSPCGAMVRDATHLYFLAHTEPTDKFIAATALRLPLAGGALEVVQEPTLGLLDYMLAVDDQAMYYNLNTGLVRIAK